MINLNISNARAELYKLAASCIKYNDVININTAYRNYKNADLICVNSDTGKSVMIQVKTGTTHSIMVGLASAHSPSESTPAYVASELQ